MNAAIENKIKELHLFLDENISNEVKENLQRQGFLKVHNTRVTGYLGANDGKIFALVKEKHWIVVTRDVDFARTLKRYGCGVILIHWSQHAWGTKRIVKEIKQALIHRHKEFFKFCEVTI